MQVYVIEVEPMEIDDLLVDKSKLYQQAEVEAAETLEANKRNVTKKDKEQKKADVMEHLSETYKKTNNSDEKQTKTESSGLNTTA